jgi:hypothetical protein
VIRLGADLQPFEVSKSTVTRARRPGSYERPGSYKEPPNSLSKATATGNNLSVVEEMFGLVEWPDFDKLSR